MIVIAFITDHAVLKKILDHLGLPAAPPPLLPPRRLWDEIPSDDQARDIDEHEGQEDIDEQSEDASSSSPRSPP